MKRRIVVVVLLVVVFLGVLVVQGVSQPTPPAGATPVPSEPPPTSTPPPYGVPIYASPPVQMPDGATAVPSPAVPQPPIAPPAAAKANFSVVQPQQQEWNFEQLVEALKGVRARQKELQTQEADILAKLAQKIEEKRQDLSKSEATLQQLRSENGHIHPAKRIGQSKPGMTKREMPNPPPPPPPPASVVR